MAETGETADFAETGETADLADTGETADLADTGETADLADTAEAAEGAESATLAEACAESATRSAEEIPCFVAVSLIGRAGWATATLAPMATTPSAPVMDQNVRDFFMVSYPSFVVLLLFCFQHGH